MKYILTTLLLIGSALALPATKKASGDKKPLSCMARGSKVRDWTVEDFDFHASYTFTTPSHQNSWGYVNFTLVNPAVDYKPICSSASSQLQDFYYGTQIYNCDIPIEWDEGTFTFDRPTGSLKINQTWNCREEGGRYTAMGGATLDLDCEDTEWKNEDWKQGGGQIYSKRDIVCKHVTQKAPIEEIMGVL